MLLSPVLLFFLLHVKGSIRTRRWSSLWKLLLRTFWTHVCANGGLGFFVNQLSEEASDIRISSLTSIALSEILANYNNMWHNREVKWLVTPRCKTNVFERKHSIPFSANFLNGCRHVALIRDWHHRYFQ